MPIRFVGATSGKLPPAILINANLMVYL